MDQIIAVFLGSTVGTAVARFSFDLIFRRHKKAEELPYQWTCEEPNCHTKFTSTHMMVLDMLTDQHKKHHSE